MTETAEKRGYYGAVYRRLWHRDDFRALSTDAKAVYLYAATAPAGNPYGVFRLRPQDVCEDFGISVRRAERALRELETAGVIRRERSWIWLRDSLENNPGISKHSLRTNTKHQQGAINVLAIAPQALAQECRVAYGIGDNANNRAEAANDHGNDSGNDYGNGNGIQGKGREEGSVEGDVQGKEDAEKPPVPSQAEIDELAYEAEEIANAANVPVTTVLREASRIEASREYPAKWFEDPRRPGISRSWIRTTRAKLPQVREQFQPYRPPL